MSQDPKGFNLLLLLGVVGLALLLPQLAVTELPPQTLALVNEHRLDWAWEWVSGMNPHYAFAGVFLLLLAAGCGLPLPEDIPLTFAGILLSIPSVTAVYGGFPETAAMVGIGAWVSILGGDLIAYWYGYRFGDHIAELPVFKHILTPAKRRRLDRWFHRFGNWTVFLGRMMAGVRIVTFITAGIARMNLGRFILFDSLGALITVPLWLTLGHVIGSNFDTILIWISRINRTTWGVVLLLLLVLLLVRRLRAKKVQTTEPQA
jgi:membrane protein DedA with SNARE-associated domain